MNFDCYCCDAYDSEREGCTMPSCDLDYACPLGENRGLRFFLPMIPPTVTAQEHKVAVINGKPRFFDTPELKEARAKLIAHLAGFAPDKPYKCALRLVVKWLFPRGSHADGEYRATKPDCDNLQKLLKDCMTACGFWRDDALVASEIVEKFWADNAGIFIGIEVLENEN